MPGKLSEAEHAFLSQHQSMTGHALNGKSEALKATRNRAIQEFVSVGFPARKSEAWKYTNISSILTEDLAAQIPDHTDPVADELVSGALLPDLNTPFVVVNNGIFDAEASNIKELPTGVVISSLQDAAEKFPTLFEQHFDRYAPQSEGLSRLNTAFVNGGLFVYVPQGVHVDQIVQVVCIGSGNKASFIQPRTLIVVDENASLTMLERSVSESGARTTSNRVIESYTGQSGRVSIIRIQDENSSSTSITSLYSVQERNSYVYGPDPVDVWQTDPQQSELQAPRLTLRNSSERVLCRPR